VASAIRGARAKPVMIARPSGFEGARINERGPEVHGPRRIARLAAPGNPAGTGYE
jgi:hypothetical protein